MSGPLRTKLGCWTCRLRKKKCDERRPRCTTCESLKIACYGFGEKPEWMDNGEKERARAATIKEIVKYTSRHKAAIRLAKQRDQNVKIAPKHLAVSVEDVSSGSGSSRQHIDVPPSDRVPSQEERSEELDGKPLASIQDKMNQDSTSVQHRDPITTESKFPISADESILLMHFLDNVFESQYPMYNPGIQEGGRGWLLALLLRSKPLYHAALALAEHHRQTVMPPSMSQQDNSAALVRQEVNHGICMKILAKLAAQPSCAGGTATYNGVGTALSVIQLLFYELFTGHENTWQVHLRLGISMYQEGYEKVFAHLGVKDSSMKILLEDLPLSDQEAVVQEEVLSVRFLTASIIWLDIASSITAGTAPRLLSHHDFALAPNSQTELGHIMGCKNWTMNLIARIAALHEHKITLILQGSFDCREYRQKSDEISRDIQNGITCDALEGLDISSASTLTSEITWDAKDLVTQVFTNTASIYLHLVTLGFQLLEDLNETISSTMRMLQCRNPTPLLPALVTPLYIIGAVAREEDEPFFRTAFSSPPVVDPALQHRGRILPILEEIWRRRRAAPEFGLEFRWEDCVEMTKDILLI